MMEICRYTSIIYADYCYFFSRGNIGPFRTYHPGRMYMYILPPPTPPPPATPPLPFPSFMDEVFSEERVKKDN